MRVAFVSILLAALSVPAAAMPWAEPGDARLRQDVELLASAHIIKGPVNAWPLPWAQLGSVEAAAADMALDPELRSAAQRIVALRDAATAEGTRAEFKGGATTRAAIIRGFDSSARSTADVSARVVQNSGNLSLSVGAGYRFGHNDRFHDGARYNFEPSYAVYTVGNWALYGGYVESWWGPGEDGALMLSTNARPVLKAGIKRLLAYPIDLPVLRWLGPIRFDAFVGRLEGGRYDHPHPFILNYRIDFSPPVLPGLEIGLSRQSLLCGRGALCSFSSVLSQVIVVGRQKNNGNSATDAADKLAGFDISYRTRIGRVGVQVYAEAQAEDAGPFLLAQYGRKVGTRVTVPLGSDGTTLQVGSEYTDTLANALFGGSARPGSFYNNYEYSDGKRNHGLALGESIDGDGNLFTIEAALTDRHNRRYYSALQRANINRTNQLGPSDTTTVQNGLSGNSVRINLAKAGAVAPTPFGDLKAEIRYMSDTPDHPGPARPRTDVEIGWQIGF